MTHALLFVVMTLTLAMPAGAAAPTSHDADIDRAREAVRTTPITGDTYRERSLLMFPGLAALQQQGADTHPFFDTDNRYRAQEIAVGVKAAAKAHERTGLPVEALAKTGGRGNGGGLLRKDSATVDRRYARMPSITLAGFTPMSF